MRAWGDAAAAGEADGADDVSPGDLIHKEGRAVNDVGQDTFVAFVLEQLSGLDGLGCRAMFGGHGLYRGATFFGILFDGCLYLKTDESTAAEYVRRGMRPFRPNDKQVLRSYYEVPADVVESRSELRRWAEASAGVAARGGAHQSKRPAASRSARR